VNNRQCPRFREHCHRKDGFTLANYETMYAIVCSAASEAIDAIDTGNIEKARRLLKTALLVAEDLYIQTAGETA